MSGAIVAAVAIGASFLVNRSTGAEMWRGLALFAAGVLCGALIFGSKP